MKCLETIDLRTSGVDSDVLDNTLARLTDELNREYEHYRVTLYRHLAVKTDWSIHIYYHSETPPASLSPVGSLISSALRKYGLVNHGIWSEINGGKNED